MCIRDSRYAVGAEVEVLIDAKGFRGARFEATVAARLGGSGSYEVVFSTLRARRRGPPLREVVAAADVRPRPPPPPPGHEIKLYDLVEACHDGGWWPGVVSAVLPKRKRPGEARYAVSLPLFREVLELRASLVRPRREFVWGRWMDAQDSLRGIPLYAEGSSVEVMCGKEGRVWMPATIIKMVGGVNYVVSCGNREGSIEVVHSSLIRPQPVFDKTKSECELEPLAEVEVYQDGTWSVGVIEDVCSFEPRRYKVRVKCHGSADEDIFLVSSTSLRPYTKWVHQECRPCSTKKHAREINDSVVEYSSEFSASGGYSDCDYLPEFSTCAESSDQYSSDSDYSPEFTSDRDIDQYSYVPTKRARKENVVKDELPLSHSSNLKQHTFKPSSTDIKKEATRVKQLESERKSVGIRAAKGEDQILTATVQQKLINTQCGEKGRRFLLKARASKRKELHSVSHGIVKTGSKSNCFDVVVISDDSSYGSSVEISDTSSSNPNRKKTRMNLSDKELHSNHFVHQYQAPQSASILSQAQNHHHDLSLEVTRYSEEQARSPVLPDSFFPLESSQDVSHKDGRQLIPLSGCLVQGLHRTNEKEPELSDNLHLETEMMSIGDSSAGDEPHEMYQKVAEVKNWTAGACKEGADISLISTRNSNQKTLNQTCDGAYPIGKLEPCSSVQQDVNADLLCIEATNDHKVEIKTGRSVMPPKEPTAFPNGKLEPSSSGQQDFKEDLLCIEAPNDNKVKTISFSTTSSLLLLSPNQMDVPERLEKMVVKNEIIGIHPKEDAALPIGVLEPSSTGQQDGKADLLCIQAPNDSKIEIKNERTGMSLEAAEGFHLENCMNSGMIADVSHPQCNASSQNSLGQLQVSTYGKSAGPSSFGHPSKMMYLSAFVPLPVPNSSSLASLFSTSSLLLMPVHKMEVFERLPHIPHFREVWNCPPEFREGKALGLMVSFANMAESIRNMRIEDEAQLYQEKMSSLIDLEENGFLVGPLKLRLHNLLCTRNRLINLKSKKASLEKEMLEIEAINCGLEQQVKFLDMCITGMEQLKYQEMKAFVDTQKAANCSSISRLQVCVRQVEESLTSAEADFCKIAAAPWQPDVGS